MIVNHIRDTFPANELQWDGMGLKQCRLLSTKTVSGTCSIIHQWSPDIVNVLIRCKQTFCVEINWTESIISSKDPGKWLGMFCLCCRIPNRRWFTRLHVQNYWLRLLHAPVHFIVQTLVHIPFLAANQIIIECPLRFIPMFLSSN